MAFVHTQAGVQFKVKGPGQVKALSCDSGGCDLVALPVKISEFMQGLAMQPANVCWSAAG